jgi:transposase-like protein
MATEPQYRFVCKNCLRTFVDFDEDYEKFCYKCGDQMICIGQNSYKISVIRETE